MTGSSAKLPETAMLRIFYDHRLIAVGFYELMRRTKGDNPGAVHVRKGCVVEGGLPPWQIMALKDYLQASGDEMVTWLEEAETVEERLRNCLANTMRHHADDVTLGSLKHLFGVRLQTLRLGKESTYQATAGFEMLEKEAVRQLAHERDE